MNRLSKISETAWLALLSLAYVIAVIVFTPMRAPWGWDEAVYASQIGKHVPSLVWGPTRGRGMPLLDAPVTLLTQSEGTLRLYLTILAGLALFATLVLWNKLVGFWVTAAGGGIFAALWIAENQASMNMGNLWLAYSVALATGLFLLYGKRPGWPVLLGLAAASFAATMFHGPTDGLLLLIALFGCLPLIPRPTRLPAALSVLAGVVAGLGEWVFEAYRYFGGPLQRVQLASKQGSGFGFFLPQYVTSLNSGVPSAAAAIWWSILLLAVCAGVYYLVRRREHIYATAAITGCVMFLGYALFIPRAETRYMLPSLILLAFVAAYGLRELLVPYRYRALVVAAIICAGVVLQHGVLSSVGNSEVAKGRTVVMTARVLHKVMHWPCMLLSGPRTDGMPIAYYAGCREQAVSPTGRFYDALAKRRSVVVLVRDGLPVPAQVASWEHRQVGSLVIYSSISGGIASRLQATRSPRGIAASAGARRPAATATTVPAAAPSGHTHGRRDGRQICVIC
jgi:hypothetical protein